MLSADLFTCLIITITGCQVTTGDYNTKLGQFKRSDEGINKCVKAKVGPFNVANILKIKLAWFDHKYYTVQIK